jgi:hypothetical protein
MFALRAAIMGDVAPAFCAGCIREAALRMVDDG